MSIFETHVKDVAERTDSDPLALNVGFQVVDSSDQLDDSDAVEAKPGHVVAVDTDSVGSVVTVNMPDVGLANSKVTVKVLDATNEVTITGASDGPSLSGDDVYINDSNSAVNILCDGDNYHVISEIDNSGA